MKPLWFYICCLIHDLWQDWSPWIYAILIVAVMALLLNGAM